MFPQFFSLAFAALIGAALGSFANVVIIRFHEEASLWGRSACPTCKKLLRPRHLIPIFSWLVLRGRCADCKAAIHIQYPLVEGAAVLLAVIVAFRYDPFVSPLLFGAELILILALLVPVVMDIRWKELPVEYLVVLGLFGAFIRGAGFTFEGFFLTQLFFDLILPVVAASTFFGLQVYLSKGRWMGSGDIWFGGMMGAILGWPGVLVGVYLAYVIGGMVALFGLAFKIYKRGDRLPFAPALALGTLIAHWYGAHLLSFFF